MRSSAARSVGVPGVVRLLEATHRKHGRLPWARLFEPAIALAENGFAMSPRLHRLAGLDRYITQPRLRAYLFDANGKVLPVDTILRNPAYARTLRAIARDGARAFYRRRRRARHRRDGDAARLESRRHHAARSRRVRGGRARARLRRVSRVPRVRISVAVVGRHRGPADPEDARALRYRVDCAGVVLRSVHFMSEAGRLAFADRACTKRIRRSTRRPRACSTMNTCAQRRR